MALPTLIKTFIFSENNTISVGGRFDGYGELMFQLKTFLTTGANPWVVVSSSDGFNVGVDLWVNALACNVHENPGSPHSWIVLQNDAIAVGFQICIDLDKNGGGQETVMRLYVSEAVGFTGGTTSNKPTAADEIDCKETGSAEWCDAENLFEFPAQLHMQRSDDGEITRWWIFVNGSLAKLVSFEKPKDAVPGWTIPWVGVVPGVTYAQTNYFPTYGQLNDIKTQTVCRANGVETRLFLTSEGAISSMLGQLQTSGNDLDSGAFPFFPIGLFSDTAGSRGRLGTLTDIWWGSTFPGTADHYPGDSSRQFVQIHDLILPWSGGSAMLVT